MPWGNRWQRDAWAWQDYSDKLAGVLVIAAATSVGRAGRAGRSGVLCARGDECAGFRLVGLVRLYALKWVAHCSQPYAGQSSRPPRLWQAQSRGPARLIPHPLDLVPFQEHHPYPRKLLTNVAATLYFHKTVQLSFLVLSRHRRPLRDGSWLHGLPTGTNDHVY
jgi:hypothetical protein